MTAKRQKKEKDVIDLMLDQLDFHRMTKDELTGILAQRYPVQKPMHIKNLDIVKCFVYEKL